MADAQSNSSSPLPPLRVHHFLTWMAVTSAVGTLWIRFLSPATMQAIDLWSALLISTFCTLIATSLTILICGMVWYWQGLSFPTHPGHWIALLVSWNFCYGIFTYYLIRKVLLYSTPVQDVMLNVPYYLVLLGVCGLGYQQATGKFWKWSWLAFALHGVVRLSFALFCIAVFLCRYVYSTFWVEGPISRQVPAILEGVGHTGYQLIASSLALALVSTAAAVDWRSSVARHWSHWAEIGVLLVCLVLNTILYLWTVVVLWI